MRRKTTVSGGEWWKVAELEAPVMERERERECTVVEAGNRVEEIWNLGRV